MSVSFISVFLGMALSNYLKSKEFELGLGRDFTLNYLQQLTKAAEYLHTRNILYLNWTCKLHKQQFFLKKKFDTRRAFS